MTLDDKSAILPLHSQVKTSGSNSFSNVVDEACEKLINRQVKYTIRRIREMEEILYNMENELDDFLLQKDRKFE